MLSLRESLPTKDLCTQAPAPTFVSFEDWKTEIRRRRDREGHGFSHADQGPQTDLRADEAQLPRRVELGIRDGVQKQIGAAPAAPPISFVDTPPGQPYPIPHGSTFKSRPSGQARAVGFPAGPRQRSARGRSRATHGEL